MTIVISQPLESLFLRRTCDSFIVECDKIFHKKYLQKSNLVVIKRDEGIEK
jgi:hypothetical protein